MYPRIVQLESLFSEGGPLGGHDRRLLLSRVSGYDLHGVRDHVRGESLRAVHWKTSARLRKLMVKEFEDTPRDEAVVVLDAHAGTVVGTAPASSFETQVRAAGSLLRRIAIAGQRASLVIAGDRLQRQRVTSLEHDWPASLELLAAVQPDGTRPLASALGESAELDAARVWIVTARLDAALGEAIAVLVAARRDVAVVWVEADSFRTAPGADERAPRPGRAARRARRAGLPGAPRRQPAGAPVDPARAGGGRGACAEPGLTPPSRWRCTWRSAPSSDWHVETLQDPRLGAGDLVPIVALALCRRSPPGRSAPAPGGSPSSPS